MNKNRRAGLPVESQADIAYRAIYDLVLGSRGNEGAVWFERQLSDQLAMGRTPVREALKRLQNEGLLTAVSAHGGLAAATISSAEVQDVYRLRAVLEALAAELAAERSAAGELPQVALTELQRRADALRERAEAKDPIGLAEANHQFHENIMVLAANPFLEEALDRLWSRIRLSAMSNFIADDDWIEETHRHHDEVVRLIVAGDAAQASSFTRHHIDRAREVYLAHHLPPVATA